MASHLFPFGFGLSYTTFRYDHLLVKPASVGVHDDILVSVDVTNAGEREGDEVAQIYLGHDVSSVETPGRSLAGFSRIKTQAAANKNCDLSNIATSAYGLEHHSKVGRRTWNLHALVGGSSKASLTTKFVLTQ